MLPMLTLTISVPLSIVEGLIITGENHDTQWPKTFNAMQISLCPLCFIKVLNLSAFAVYQFIY